MGYSFDPAPPPTNGKEAIAEAKEAAGGNPYTLSLDSAGHVQTNANPSTAAIAIADANVAAVAPTV